jgi:hypothetical protein
LEKLYQKNRDIAEFRLIYIREAHPADGNRPAPYAKKLGITEHGTLSERCSTAEKLLKDKQLTIPCLIDDMQDSANRAYAAWPDRIYVIASDGTIAVAAEPGPAGFKPGVEQTAKWLDAFRHNQTDK